MLAPSSPSRHHRRRHQRPQRRWSRFVSLLLSAPVYSTQLIVYKYSWFDVRCKQNFCQMISLLLYIFFPPWHKHSFRCPKKSAKLYIWPGLLFFCIGISRMWRSLQNVARNSLCDHRNQAIQTTLFRDTKNGRRRRRQKRIRISVPSKLFSTWNQSFIQTLDKCEEFSFVFLVVLWLNSMLFRRRTKEEEEEERKKKSLENCVQ